MEAIDRPLASFISANAKPEWVFGAEILAAASILVPFLVLLALVSHYIVSGDVLSISQRGACAALGQHRSTQRKLPQGRDDALRLTADIVEPARQDGRYGYREIAELLRRAGWLVNAKRGERTCGALSERARVHNTVNFQRHLISRSTLRTFRATAWQTTVATS